MASLGLSSAGVAQSEKGHITVDEWQVSGEGREGQAAFHRVYLSPHLSLPLYRTANLLKCLP